MKIGILVAFMVIVVLAMSFVSADECTEGQVKREDCNTCRCLQGNWACTKIGCLHKRAIPDRFDVQARQKRDQFSCIPGQTFARDCNTCTCTPDGRNAICTLMACDQLPRSRKI